MTPAPAMASRFVRRLPELCTLGAEDVVAELIDADTDTDRDELLTQLINDRCDQHDYVINDELRQLLEESDA